MSSMNTPSLLNWGLRIYFYILLIVSFNMASVVGIVLSLGGFLIMEVFCEQLHNEYTQNYNSKLLDNCNDTTYNQILK
jgi:hypothetical protein